jgi:hypothetical protein
MLTQPTLFDTPAAQERFEAFLVACPDVYPAFVRLALEMKRKGRERHSADGLGHILRWQMFISGAGVDDYKFNNNYISAMARKAMAENPELDGFFEIRKLKN